MPPAPTRGDPHHKVGLTLPVEIAERVRSLTRDGYALSDLVMVAYQDHRDRLVDENHVATPRRLVQRPQGRTPVTLVLSSAERAAIDALVEHLGSTRSHTVAALLTYQLEAMR